MSVTIKRKSATRKKNAVKQTRRAAAKKSAKKSVADSYDRYKVHEGKQYTGMQIGRSHKWYYDKGEWKETKITPDLWRIFYSVTKRRLVKHRKVRVPKWGLLIIGTYWRISGYKN